MNIDEEIEEFLQNEKRMFENKRREIHPHLIEKKSIKEKEKERERNIKVKQEQLKESWRTGRKKIKIACHNVNGLKTKGWKLKSLLG